jgi:hypothetical protein
MDKKSRKTIKEIQKELNRLKDLLKEAELRPCHGDADLRQKQEEMEILKREIYDIEKETNKLVLFIDRGEVKST